ncbi:MAG TPA: DNA polymerase ligase N-terminal domain-containing protein [Polyangia bacterium]|nr:DNA polymerase ligase N-terminal domain-containing protein [Polyangia bacterium]
MGLAEYNRKRNFGITREPPGAPPPKRARRARMFVIQKHAATRLHYDFRLELEGVLKSWSVPKGPSLDPKVKRLAMQTEDHPIAYADFEGIIPKGQYGGGTVLLWDRGTWEPQGDPHQDFAAGNLKFLLKGDKLHGGFALIKLKGRGPGGARDQERAWLLIKEKDVHTRDEGQGIITDQRPESVTTGRTLDQIAAERDHVWHSNRDQIEAGQIEGARQAPLPDPLRVPAVTDRAVPPSGTGWLHEMEMAGDRMLARVDGDDVTLLGPDGARLPKSAAARRKRVASDVRLLPAKTLIVDGVLTALRADGHPDPGGLPAALGGRGKATLAYFLFDLPYFDGTDLRAVPLRRRKELLASLVARVAEKTCLRYLDHIGGSGVDFHREACRLQIPGMISRQEDSAYDGRARWIRVACAPPIDARKRPTRRPAHPRATR